MTAPKLLSWAGVLRRGWIVPLVTACAAVAAVAATRSQEVTYTAEAVVQVRSGASAAGPGAANDATTLARTYASAIPENERVLRAVERRDEPPAGRVAVVNDPGTSLLRLQFRDTEADQALTGARALLRSVLDAPRRSAIGRGSLSQVSTPRDITSNAPDTRQAVIVGLLLGAFVGVLLLLAWERADRRIDDERDLRADFPAPVSAFVRPSPGGAQALREQLVRMAAVDAPRVALVPVNRRSVPGAEDVRGQLDAGRAGPDGARFDVSPVLGTLAEPLVTEADLVVLVVARGSSAREVAVTTTVLEQFDCPPRWALVVAPRRLMDRLRRRPAPAADPPAAAAADGARSSDVASPR